MKNSQKSDFRDKTYIYQRGNYPIYEQKYFPQFAYLPQKEHVRKQLLASNTNIYIMLFQYIVPHRLGEGSCPSAHSFY